MFNTEIKFGREGHELLFGDRISSSGWSQICYPAEAFPELLILLLPPPECLGHRHVLTYLAKLTF